MAAGGGAAGVEPGLLKQHGVIGDVLDAFTPTVAMSVQYGEGAAVADGQKISPKDASRPPKVEIAGSSDTDLYTLVMSDPDAPSPQHPSAREWLHWIVVNIPGASTIPESGEEVVSYNGPTPPAGVHRYVFSLFRQQGKIKVSPPDTRKNFRTREFAHAHNLGSPVAASFFLSEKEA